MKQSDADRIRRIFHSHHALMSSLQAELLLTGLKITSSTRVMLPFDSPPKSSFFSGKAICCPLRICRTERASGAELSHELDPSVMLDYILASLQPAGVLLPSSL